MNAVHLTNAGFILFFLFCISDEDEDNQDTVEQILKCIIENEGDCSSSGSSLSNFIMFYFTVICILCAALQVDTRHGYIFESC